MSKMNILEKIGEIEYDIAILSSSLHELSEIAELVEEGKIQINESEFNREVKVIRSKLNYQVLEKLEDILVYSSKHSS